MKSSSRATRPLVPLDLRFRLIFAEVVHEMDANPVSFYRGRLGQLAKYGE